jgi:hypothetical protein
MSWHNFDPEASPRHEPDGKLRGLYESIMALEDEFTDPTEILMAPTDKECSHCGQRNLRRFEALNGRCESCRIRLVLHMERTDEGEIRCPVPDGQWCSGYWHGLGREASARCPRFAERCAAAGKPLPALDAAGSNRI